ncbi:MAG: hypothetical protein IPK83_00615 [Planctomycetes bacterium]|nr:hypothetical protein [Planctomycetota bacterium]
MSRSALTHLLHDMRTRFDASSRNQRRELLKKAASQPIPDLASLRSHHDTLLFIAAHPDDADMRRRADRELNRIAKAVADLAPHQRKSLRNSGIAGSITTHAFTLDFIRWLIKSEPRAR